MPRALHPKLPRRSIYGLLLGSAGMLTVLVLLHREVHRPPTAHTTAAPPTAVTTSARPTTTASTRPAPPVLTEPMLPASEDPWM